MEVLEADAAFDAELETEFRLVREAILVVAAGVARRVVVSNLRHGRVILEPSRDAAAAAGIHLSSVPTSDARRIDLAAERLAVVAPDSER
jgi:hypothetical protein